VFETAQEMRAAEHLKATVFLRVWIHGEKDAGHIGKEAAVLIQ